MNYKWRGAYLFLIYRLFLKALFTDLLSPPTNDFKFHYSNGDASLQDGHIYYSPNCSRPVILPPHGCSTQFNQDMLSASMFRQPVRWSSSYGWMSFIPLSPSFTSLPFEPLCWMPRIMESTIDVEVNGYFRPEKRFTMKIEDMLVWMRIEEQISSAADILCTDFGIPGSPPPLPSKFGYTDGHRSNAVAEKMIILSRDWFTIWMGFLSYAMAQAEIHANSRKMDTNHLLPVWYRHLLTRDFSEAWLNGLSSSSVCLFSEQNPRCGIVLDLARYDKDTPPLRFFIAGGFPLWFVWTKWAEQEICRYPVLHYLQPPDELLERALKLISSTSSAFPLTALTFKHYHRLPDFNRETVKLLRLDEASSYVDWRLSECFSQGIGLKTDDAALRRLNKLRLEDLAALHQSAAAAAALPSQGMLEKDDEYDRVCNDWKDFFEARERRQKELEMVQSAKDCQRREARKANPPIKTATMYEWKKIMTSGGKEVYVRIRVTKRLNGHVHRSYSDLESRYNHFFNEWDFCKEFSGKSAVVTGFSFDSSSDDDDDNMPHFIQGKSCENTAPRQSSPHQRFEAPQMFSPKRLSPLMPSGLPRPRTPPGPPLQHHLQPESTVIDTDVVSPTPSRLPSPCTPPQLPGPRSPPGSPPQHDLQPEYADVGMEVVGPTPSRSPGPRTPRLHDPRTPLYPLFSIICKLNLQLLIQMLLALRLLDYLALALPLGPLFSIICNLNLLLWKFLVLRLPDHLALTRLLDSLALAPPLDPLLSVIWILNLQISIWTLPMRGILMFSRQQTCWQIFRVCMATHLPWEEPLQLKI